MTIPVDRTTREKMDYDTLQAAMLAKIEVAHQADVAHSYALILRAPEGAIDWTAINAAIIERWSENGLGQIKRLAWTLAANQLETA